jgi:hypothetical protein
MPLLFAIFNKRVNKQIKQTNRVRSMRRYTAGVNHIKWWTKQGATYTETSGTFGVAAKHTVMSAVWLPSGRCLTVWPYKLNAVDPIA